MERRLQKIVFFAIFVINSVVSAQVPSFVERIRIPMWAELDAYPGSPEAGDLSGGVFDFPINRLKQTAPFIIEGMVFGWEFTYVPSDKTRQVDEIFEIIPIREDESYLKDIQYSSPVIKDNRLNVWVEFLRTNEMIHLYNMWASINHPIVKGRGTGKISNGFDGLKDAVSNAVRNAVREYYRTKVKNKPKEINGKVLIRSEPQFGIRRGEYVVTFDFFLETDRIIQYNTY